MKRATFSILALLLFIGCQSAYHIPKESLPKKLTGLSLQLMATDKTTHSLETIYKNHAATVLIFWQIGCPCVRRYQERVNHLYRTFAQDNVAFVHISSSTIESFQEVIEEYKKRAIPLPLMRDSFGSIAHALGVKGTPAAAIIDQKGELLYLGWIDNERNEHEKGRIPFLANALTEVLSGQSVTTKTSPMFGCPIR